MCSSISGLPAWLIRRAAYETEFPLSKAEHSKTIVIVGLGVAGLSCAYYAALRGHHVTAYDAGNLGGQFNLAARMPGKAVYLDTVRYFKARLVLLGVKILRNHKVGIEDLRDVYVDAIVFATGVTPRKPDIQGSDHFSVMDYETAIKNRSTIKDKVAIIGAGGIGFDVAEMLISQNENNADWYRNGISMKVMETEVAYFRKKVNLVHNRTVYFLQRKNDKLGKNLARTTGWVRRLSLRKAGVTMMSGVRMKKLMILVCT